jgi:hypothetical protein
MKRFITVAVLAGLGCAGIIIGCAKSSTAAQDPVMTADTAVVNALASGNMTEADQYLDNDFTWIDTDGVMWEKEDSARAHLKPLVPLGKDVKYVEHKYGKVVWIQESVGNKYAAHTWVERPSGWKLLINAEIATRPASENPDRRVNFAIPCVNPCQEVPYVPITDNEKATLAAWQDQEHGGQHWYNHVPESNVVVSSYGVITKDQRWKFIQARMKSHAPEVSADPVTWMRTWDLGTAVVMICDQPTWNGKSYWASRVFAPDKQGTWEMYESYHTTIQKSPILMAKPPEKEAKK